MAATFDRRDPLGATLRCAFDVDRSLSLCSGVEVVENAVARRLTSFLWYAPDYGFPLTTALNSTRINTATLANDVELELAKDPRIASVACTTTVQDEKVNVRIDVTVSTDETFTIVGSLSAGYAPVFTKVS
jgi:hypothetical protein